MHHKPWKHSFYIFAATGYVGFWLLMALMAPWVSADKTRLANYQVLEIAKAPPGARVWVLEAPIAQPAQSDWSRFWMGPWPRFRPLALASPVLAVEGDRIRFIAFSGLSGYIHWSELGLDGPPDPTLAATRVRQLVFPLGADTAGRDLWSRLVHGARVSLLVGLVSMLLSISLGVAIGGVAGYVGGWADRALMGLVAVVWSVPTLLLALALSFVLGKGLGQLMLAIGLSIWVDTARLVRGQLLSLREQTFAEAAISMGFRDLRILVRHLLPNVWAPVLVMAVSNFGAAILIESGLSFLGLGAEPPMASWGGMIYEGYTQLVFQRGAMLAFIPGLCLILLVVSVNLAGIGLRDRLDIRTT